ncbi:hypothetical protein LCGC14_2326110 [marine sediment metagenome]|uniref:Uncharacterized protein n=1 Tax=marine sediment metagenome TaxID=412755 RepID=A0A0F9D3W2_9ZZZZ
MTDEEYRQFVETERLIYGHYARSLKQTQDEYVRQLIWLRIMGLMET